MVSVLRSGNNDQNTYLNCRVHRQHSNLYCQEDYLLKKTISGGFETLSVKKNQQTLRFIRRPSALKNQKIVFARQTKPIGATKSI